MSILKCIEIKNIRIHIHDDYCLGTDKKQISDILFKISALVSSSYSRMNPQTKCEEDNQQTGLFI